MRRRPPRPSVLTPRERQVARLIAEGNTAPEIGAELGIAETTVRGYIQQIARVVTGRGPPMRRIAMWYREESREL